MGGRGSAVPEDWGWIDVRTLSLREASGTTTNLLSGVELHRPGDDDETDARVPLPREVQPGETVRIDVAFDDKLPTSSSERATAGSFHMVGQWFPKVARLEPDGTWAHFPFHHLAEFYADFGTYDVTLDVPAGYTIGATGPDRRDPHRGTGAASSVTYRATSTTSRGLPGTIGRPRTRQSTASTSRSSSRPASRASRSASMAALRFALPYD